MVKCKEIYSHKIEVNNMLFNKLGINYDKHQLITEEKQQNNEFDRLALYIPHFMKNIWDNPKSVATILSILDQKDLIDISHFIVHNLYDNIVPTQNNEHQLMYIISLLLQKEINEMKDDNDILFFLNNTSCGFILEELIYKKDVQSFFKVNLLSVIEKLEMELSSNPITFNLEEIQKKLLSNKINDYSFLKNNNSMIRRINKFNYTYLTNMNQDSLNKNINEFKDKDKDMKEYLQKKSLDCANSPNIYSTEEFSSKINNYKESKNILNYYINSFMGTINFIDMFLDNLKLNSNSLPYSIKCICKIISLLIKKKFPNANKVEQNAFIAKFFFQKLVFPILNNPSLILLINEFLLSDKTMEDIRQIKEILNQFT